VDIVSIYQWLFTETKELPSTVAHFERYPRIPVSDEVTLTPDFTVLFHDGRGIAGEIANTARHEGSIESLCSQLQKYSRLTELPNAGGGMSPVDPIDVLWLTPMETATAAVRRVFERFDDPTHDYKPLRRPVVVQFSSNPDNYVLQFWPDKSVTGALAPTDVFSYADFDEDMKVPPDKFKHVKVKYAFMNDPVKPLYLATRLWTSIFPSQFGTSEEFVATTQEIAEVVKAQYGHVRTADVEAAMGILRAAGLATDAKPRWRVRRRKLRHLGEVHEAIAGLVDRGTSEPRRRKGSSQGELALFDLDSESGLIDPSAVAD